MVIDTMKSEFFKESLRLLNMQLGRLVIEKGWSVKIFWFLLLGNGEARSHIVKVTIVGSMK
jgi:hypothetical protein